MEASEHKTNIQENTGAPLQISDAIDRLLSNPELLSSVAAAIGVQPPTSDTSADKKSEAEQKSAANDDKIGETAATVTPSKLPDLMANAAPILAALSSGKGSNPPDDDRTRLLCALKPYVNPHRKEAIDTIVSLARISEAIKAIK